MKKLAQWSVNNRVAVNLIMMFIIVAGLLTVMNMRREMFPQFALDMINVSVPYPGASPAEVEEGICIKIEEKIKGIENISRTYSSSREGLGSVTVELDKGADVQKIIDDIKNEVDLIDNFPDEAEDPIITEIINRNPAITVAVYGDVPEKLLRRTADRIRDDLVDTGPISLATLVGVRDYEIAVEVSEENLRRYGLSFDQVVQALRTGSLDLPGGTIKTDHGEIIVRAKGQLYTGNEFEDLPLITDAAGTVVRLGQVATVVDGFEDTDIKARFNSKPAALVQVNRTSQEDVIAISDTVQQYVAESGGRMPDGIQLATWFDLSTMVRDRIDLLLRNGLQGIILVFIVLALFLNLRLAFWVSVGIPVSFMGAFMVLDYNGETINMISLFAFIMTLGILVDDAIIVGENIFTHYGQGKSSDRAVVDGMGEVGWPVLMAVTTTVVAFTPLMFITGIMGKFISVMPRAVIAILIVSLGEASSPSAHLEGALVGVGVRVRRLAGRSMSGSGSASKRASSSRLTALPCQLALRGGESLFCLFHRPGGVVVGMSWLCPSVHLACPRATATGYPAGSYPLEPGAPTTPTIYLDSLQFDDGLSAGRSREGKSPYQHLLIDRVHSAARLETPADRRPLR